MMTTMNDLTTSRLELKTANAIKSVDSQVVNINKKALSFSVVTLWGCVIS